MCHNDLRARLSRALNDALSTCDRAGRKPRRADFILGVRLGDDPDGKLGSWVDDDARLRLQKRRRDSTVAGEVWGVGSGWGRGLLIETIVFSYCDVVHMATP